MNYFFKRKRKNFSCRLISLFVCLTFISSLVTPNLTYAQSFQLTLPPPGTMIALTPAFTPPLLVGLKVDSNNPFNFNFIVDNGDTNLKGNDLKTDSERMIRYFFAALTLPDNEVWVNLSPYEKDKIAPEKLGNTDLGRDLLAQDYILKQLTASLMFPEESLGKDFWDKVYKKAHDLYGTTNIPVNTFNKVWIVPQRAAVYETQGTAFVVDSHLQVMLEEDYFALQNNLNDKDRATDTISADQVAAINKVSSPVVKEVLIPAIEEEVNKGKNFAQLRQIYNAIILSVWFKKRLKESILGQIYIDKNKIAGVDINDKTIKEQIYNQYSQAFKQGVFNYIREDYDNYTKQPIPRKYFSGGFSLVDAKRVPIAEMTTIAETPEALPPTAQAGLIDMETRQPTHFAEVAAAITPTTSRIGNMATLSDGGMMGKESISAFENAVAAAVKGLTPDKLPEVEALKAQWATQPGVTRKYSAEAVVSMRPHPSIRPDYAVAKNQAQMFKEETAKAPIVALGALSAAQAEEYIKGGARAIYVSGWQIAGKEMLPDISSHPNSKVIELAKAIIDGMSKASAYESRLGRTFKPVPLVVDVDAGFGGPAAVFNLVTELLKVGVGVIHIENQDLCEKECGHLGAKIENSHQMYLNNVAAARLAADIAGVPLEIIGRTDSEAAASIRGEADNDALNREWLVGTVPQSGRELTLQEAKAEGLVPIWDAKQDEIDHKVQTFGADKVWVANRAVEGYYILMKKDQKTNIEYAIATALGFAPYVDRVWMESKTPDLEEAMHFAEAIHAQFPGKPLAYNLSPSFNWLKYFKSEEDGGEAKAKFIRAIKKIGIKPNESFDWDKDYTPEEAMRAFTYAIGKIGYGFSFVTLAGFHTERFGAHELAKQFFGGDYMKAYSAFQQREFTAQKKDGFTAVKHQEEVGSEFFEALDILVKGGATSRALLKQSTEAAQFGKAQSPIIIPTAIPGGNNAALGRPQNVLAGIDIAKFSFPNQLGNPKDVGIQQVRNITGQPVDMTQYVGEVGSGKIVNPRSTALKAYLAEKYGDAISEVLKKRELNLAAMERGEVKPSYRPETDVINDAYGGHATVKEIREGAWKVDAIPERLDAPGIILTGPWTPAMAISALSGKVIEEKDRKLYNEVLDQLIAELSTSSPEDAQVLRNVQADLAKQTKVVPVRIFADFEDAVVTTPPGKLEGPQVVSDILNGRLTEVVNAKKNKTYTIPPKGEWPTITIRIPGLHLMNENESYKGKPMYEAITHLVYAVEPHVEALKADPNLGMDIVVPKLETPEELVLAIHMMEDAKTQLELKNPFNIVLMNETEGMTRELEEAIWAGRHHVKVTNVGRWDKGATDVRLAWFAGHQVYPDINSVGMQSSHMDAYVRRNAAISIKRGVKPEGGMVTAMPSEGNKDPQADKQAIRNIVLDKLHEWKLGYDYAWAASPGYVPIAQLIFQQPRAKAPELTPVRYDHQSLSELLSVPTGNITQKGVYENAYELVTYILGYRNSGGAVAIDNLNDGGRKMYDLATGKKSQYNLWTYAQAQPKLTGTDTVVDKQYIESVIDQVIANTHGRYRQFFSEDEIQIAKIIAMGLITNPKMVLHESIPMNYTMGDRDPNTVSQKLGRWLTEYNRTAFTPNFAKTVSVDSASSIIPGSPAGVFGVLLQSKTPMTLDDIALKLGRAVSTIQPDLTALKAWGIVEVNEQGAFGLVDKARTASGQIMPVLLDIPKARPTRAERDSFAPRIASILGTTIPTEGQDQNLGGINLNTSLMNLEIKRDGNGVPLPVNMQPIMNMDIQGFTPMIINITPVTNLPLLLGSKEARPSAVLAASN